MALCLEALALTLVPSNATWPSLTSPARWHRASTCRKRPDSAAKWSLRKVGDGAEIRRVVGGQAHGRRYPRGGAVAMRRDDATPVQ